MMQPYRTYNAGNYAYGFGGQEKSDDIKGEGNSYTAKFWEYDPRIGRRLNPDPVTKIWLSPFSAFRNNPLFFFDPKGDDDYFDMKGRYLGSVGSTHDIRVITNSKITMSQAAKDVSRHTKVVTEFTYFPKDQSNRSMLTSIMSFYAKDLKIKQVDIWEDQSESRGNAFAYLSRDFENYKKGYFVAVNNGKINEDAGQRFNVLSSLRHEKEHELNAGTRKNNIGHIDAVIADINSDYFEKSTWGHKEGAIT